MGLFSRDDIFIVTGASSGIGKAVALLLNKEGASVVMIARNKERLEESKNLAQYSDRIFCEQKDLTNSIEDFDEYIKSLKNKYGKFRGLAYCAGILSLKSLKSISFFETIDLFKINYFSPLFMTKAISDKRNISEQGASIVAVASAEAFIRDKGCCTYAGSKSALQTSFSIMAKELAQKKVRINTVSPSDIATPMTINRDIDSVRQDYEKKYPLGFGQPQDVAELIVFLLSDKAKWITGQDYIIDCASF